MNTVKCKDCRFYDAIRSAKSKNPQHGWCTIKSTYPHKEELGQVFPPGVKRAATPDSPAKPEIVAGDSRIETCIAVVQK